MKKLNSFWVALSLIFELMLFLTGCHSNPIPIGVGPSYPVPASSPTLTSSPTVEITSTLTSTSTKVPTKVDTATLFPTGTTQPSPTLTWTPRPTLPPDEARSLAYKMVKTNGDCLFPCWLGIFPGQTRWEEARAVLETYADRIESGNDNFTYAVDLTLSQSLGGRKDFGAGIYVDGGIVTGFETVMPISLPELLNTYGPPSAIYINAIGWVTIGKKGQFILVLVYSEKGIMAVYDGDVARGRTLYISPDQFYEPRLTTLLLWSPSKKMTFAEGGRKLGVIADPPYAKDYLPLEKISNMNPQSFYQRYKDPQNSGLYFQMEAPDYPKDKS